MALDVDDYAFGPGRMAPHTGPARTGGRTAEQQAILVDLVRRGVAHDREREAQAFWDRAACAALDVAWSDIDYAVDRAAKVADALLAERQQRLDAAAAAKEAR